MGNLARYHVENLPELMKVIRSNGIGMDDYLDRFFNNPTQQNYPPYNIIQVNNVETRLEVALAGPWPWPFAVPSHLPGCSDCHRSTTPATAC